MPPRKSRPAIEAAKRSSERHRIGACIWRGGRFLAAGYNKKKSDPNFSDWECSHIHAEIDALKKISDPVGATLYVVRVSRSGTLRLAKPCERCEEELRLAGIARVVYSDDRDFKEMRFA